MLNENPAGYLVLPAWIIFVFVFRRSAPARVFLIFFALTIPMITLLLVWRNQPRNLIPLFMLSAVVVAAVTVAGARYLIRVATPRSPRVRLGLWPAAIVLLTGGIVFLTWNSQIRYSLASSYGAAEVVITGEPCAQWLREHAPSESSIAITALYDEAFYFLMDGVQFEVHPIYPQNSFFTLTEDGHLFTKNKIYIGRRPGAAPEQRPYQYLDEDIWLRTLQENNIDFYVFEGTTNVVVAPFAGQRYFDRHPGLQLVCTDSSPSVVTAVYKVNQAMLGSLNATYLDRQALSALEADATAQAELLNRSQLLDAIGKQVSVVSPVEIELAVTYQHMADVYRETGSQDLAQFYATRAAVYDPTTVDAAQEATLVRYWTDNLANDGWSAAALAAYYGAKALSAEAAAVYSNAVNNLNQDYDLYSALNGRLAQFGTIATRIELAQAALAAWPTDNTAFATLMALQLANKDQYAAQLTQMRWLAVQENDAPIYQRIAQLYVQAQELQMGESVLLEAYHRWPENGNLVLSLADLYTAQGRHDKAAELLTDSLRTIADDDQLYGKLVEVYLALNDIGAAEQVLSAWQPASSSKYQSLLQISLQQMQEAATLNVDHWLDAQ